MCVRTQRQRRRSGPGSDVAAREQLGVAVAGLARRGAAGGRRGGACLGWPEARAQARAGRAEGLGGMGQRLNFFRSGCRCASNLMRGNHHHHDQQGWQASANEDADLIDCRPA
jgi:hypothetical protein